MTTTNLLAGYENGNVSVRLYSDGTKIREYSGTPRPVHPESIDLKITDWCDAGCAYCHESSTVRGQHASVESIERIISSLPAGVEIAVGGGDPLSHPRVSAILELMANRGLVSNVTVNGRHTARHTGLIKELRRRKLVYGLGVSYWHSADLEEIRDADTIVHFIAGVDNPWDALRQPEGSKMLVLGYKQFGRGLAHFSPETERCLKAWRFWTPSVMRRFHTCFDNLALRQLGVRKLVPDAVWEESYMGDDGTFTMYVDAVRNEYAVSSTSPRLPLGGLQTAFREIIHRAEPEGTEAASN